jgi:hypothetical protein
MNSRPDQKRLSLLPRSPEADRQPLVPPDASSLAPEFVARLRAFDSGGSTIRSWLIGDAVETGSVPDGSIVCVIVATEEVLSRETGAPIGLRLNASDTTGEAEINIRYQDTQRPSIFPEEVWQRILAIEQKERSALRPGTLIGACVLKPHTRASHGRVRDGRVSLFSPYVFDPNEVVRRPSRDDIEGRLGWDAQKFVERNGPCCMQDVIDGVTGKAAMIRTEVREAVRNGDFLQESGPRGAKMLSFVKRLQVVIP